MSERRRDYAYNRVLIDSARVLAPQFDDAVIHVTGAQLEMLRNVTQYLRRVTTYVAETHTGYYLTPTTADIDDILEIVADLEEKLMGNPNTLWGYSDVWSETFGEQSVGDPETSADTTPVPAGFVYKLERWRLRHNHGSAIGITVRAYVEGVGIYIYDVPALPHLEDVFEGVTITFKEGDFLRVTAYGLNSGQTIEAKVTGYMMVVP